MNSYKRFFIFLFTALMLVGAYGQKKHIKSKPPKNKKIENVSPASSEDLLQMFEQSFDKLRTTYVDSVNEEEIIKSAIKGMLKPLDPYTVLLQGRSKDRFEMLTKGKYGGVGIQISMRRDTLIVLSPMEDSPAYREGIKAGDKILMIDSTSTKGMSLRDASDLIKGELGSAVTLQIFRPSTRKKLEFTLVRANIPINDVPYWGVDEDKIAYIRVTKFSRNTSRDFRKALLELTKQDIAGLVIDLRGNSGGLLNNALYILDELLPRQTKLLSTRGRVSIANKTMFARRNPSVNPDLPIAVLINESSASASEIVSGALQDLDRAVIVGEKSFGKGLVQSMFNINDSTKLKVTTAKYYTPSGRLIQKYDYLDNGVLTDGLDKKDSTFTTIGGRKVKGGGVTPDVEVKPEKIPPFVQQLWKQGLFLTFAATYVPTHDIPEKLIINKNIVNEFKTFLKEYKFNYKEIGESELGKLIKTLKTLDDLKPKKKKNIFSKLFFWKNDKSIKLLTSDLDNYFQKKKDNPFHGENLRWIKNGLLREMSRVIGGNKAKIASSLDDDIVYQKATSILLDANVYYDIFIPQPEIKEKK
ncbi:MAG: S41 family peptidase [Candidatus Marinimicrobia bacterium]|nr:S41 family peptidase [Candidatus Neomarinimicrobiota bacterium]MBL7022764.1 S41 family peptidase [Candidatus Neomarinimicrobiota bacterium]MBL7109715.1 S41 family peptidase [Candidatus Neomarinimicrobiota bacterium]